MPTMHQNSRFRYGEVAGAQRAQIAPPVIGGEIASEQIAKASERVPVVIIKNV